VNIELSGTMFCVQDDCCFKFYVHWQCYRKNEEMNLKITNMAAGGKIEVTGDF
jgi:hypothetical protein